MNTSLDYITVKCPKCDTPIHVMLNELACTIFRCGADAANYKQSINPHSTKNEIDRMKLDNKIVGCGQPFKVECKNITLTVGEIELLKKEKFIFRLEDINIITLSGIYERLKGDDDKGGGVVIPIYFGVVCDYI